MKKLVLSLAVVFAVGMVSCGGGDKAANENGDSATLIEETMTVEGVEAPEGDSTVADSNATETPETPAETEAPADSTPA